jgi:hypothetical protein
MHRKTPDPYPHPVKLKVMESHKNITAPELHEIICPIAGFVHLPHHYYTVTTFPNNPPGEMIKNYGDMKGKGNRKPSNPGA